MSWMMRKLVVLSAAICVACAQIPVLPKAAQAEMQRPVKTPVPVTATDIQGSWDIVEFDGYRPARLRGSTPAAFASFDSHGVRLRIECNHAGSSGTVQAGRFVTNSGSPSFQTEMGCGKEREERDSRLFSFFAKSPTLTLLPNGRLLLRAEGSELLLERPEVRRLANIPDAAELQGMWRLIELTKYGSAGGLSGIGLSDMPGRISFAGNRLEYDRCPQFGLQYRLGEDGRLAKIAGKPLPLDLSTCRDLSIPTKALALPSASQIIRILHSNPAVERSGGGMILLSTSDHGLLLSRAP